MAFGKKQNETRSWPTKHRGDLVICSAKRKPTVEEAGEHLDEMMQLPFGFALCVVELFDCLPSERFNYKDGIQLSECEKDLGDYSPGRWIWMTRNLRKLKEPVPIRGHQGLWILDEYETFSVVRQISESYSDNNIEWQICFDTRIGILCGTGEPTEKQKQLAAIEADAHIEALKQQAE